MKTTYPLLALFAIVLIFLNGCETAANGPASPVVSCDNTDGALDDAAFVIVASPTAGQRVSPGFTVTGCSRTFESTVVWRLVARFFWGQVLHRNIFFVGKRVEEWNPGMPRALRHQYPGAVYQLPFPRLRSGHQLFQGLPAASRFAAAMVSCRSGLESLIGLAIVHQVSDAVHRVLEEGGGGEDEHPDRWTKEHLA